MEQPRIETRRPLLPNGLSPARDAARARAMAASLGCTITSSSANPMRIGTMTSRAPELVVSSRTEPMTPPTTEM